MGASSSRTTSSSEATGVDLGATVSGVLAVTGVVTLGAAVIAIATAALDLNANDVGADQWRPVGAAMAALATLVLLAAMLAGGYVAGRLAGRRSDLHALVVVGVVVGVVATALGVLAAADDLDDVRRLLDGEGIPTDGSTWTTLLLVFLVAAVVVSVVGAVTGARRGVATDRRLRVPAEWPLDEIDAPAAAPVRRTPDRTAAAGTLRVDQPGPPGSTMVHVIPRAEAERVGSRYWATTDDDDLGAGVPDDAFDSPPPAVQDPWASDARLDSTDLRRLRSSRRRVRN